MYRWQFIDWYDFYLSLGMNEEEAKDMAKKAMEEAVYGC